MIFDQTELCKLAYKYGSDKCPQLKHTYTPFYFDLFKDKRVSVKKVMEIGIGYYNGIENSPTNYDKTLKRNYHKGASLKMWRDFFPNATIYGADIKAETMFSEERIKTFVCDERKTADIANLISKTGHDIDIFIDDGSHLWRDQLFLAQTALPLLPKDVIYIIEDVRLPIIIEQLKKYDCIVPNMPKTSKDNCLILVKNI